MNKTWFLPSRLLNQYVKITKVDELTEYLWKHHEQTNKSGLGDKTHTKKGQTTVQNTNAVVIQTRAWF